MKYPISLRLLLMRLRHVWDEWQTTRYWNITQEKDITPEDIEWAKEIQSKRRETTV